MIYYSCFHLLSVWYGALDQTPIPGSHPKLWALPQPRPRPHPAPLEVAAILDLNTQGRVVQRTIKLIQD